MSDNPAMELLEKITRDIHAAGFPFTPTAYWIKESNDFIKEIDHNIKDPLYSVYNTRLHGITNSDGRLFTWFLNMLHAYLRTRDFLGLLDTINPGPIPDASADGQTSEAAARDLVVWIDGRAFYPDLLFSIYDFYNMVEIDPRVATDEVIVGDIGAGWGRIGHVLCQANPAAKYLVFDIPASLVLSSTVLPRMLPEVPIVGYEASRMYDTISREILAAGRVWFLGSHDLAHVERGAVDLFVNIASFQEMTIEQVNSYLLIIDSKLNAGSVYFRNNAFSKFGLASATDYHMPARWKRRFARRTAFSPIIMEAGLSAE